MRVPALCESMRFLLEEQLPTDPPLRDFTDSDLDRGVPEDTRFTFTNPDPRGPTFIHWKFEVNAHQPVGT